MALARPKAWDSQLRLGAAVSVAQSALFVAIGLAALGLGMDRLVASGFAGLYASNSALFVALCTAFVAIAVLGLAITSAEKLLIEPFDRGLATFGGNLAYLGHAGTIAFFSWWLFYAYFDDGRTIDPNTANAVAPIQWGVTFELVFVGAWVWIIADVIRQPGTLPRGFLYMSVVKAKCFWFTFIAFLANNKVMLIIGLGATTLFAGPVWHLWIARLFLAHGEERLRA